MKRFFVLMAFVFAVTESFGQWKPYGEGKTGYFNHLELAGTVGTTGIGLDIAMPVGEFVQVRTGITYVPHFKHYMNFGIYVGNDESSAADQSSRFEKMADLLEEFTGTRIDNSVKIEGRPYFTNFKLLVDIFPLKNKHWYLTGGFYAGGAGIGKACNTIEEVPTLFSVTMYNHIYEKAIDAYENDEPFITVGESDIYISEEYYDRLVNTGRAGVHIGRYKDTGKYYMMEPDENNLVRATVKVSRIRPYVGFGYRGNMLKKNDRFGIGFDCGVMMWGRTPSIITHDGTDLTKDVYDIGGKVGNYVRVISRFKVYPTVNLRIGYRIF